MGNKQSTEAGDRSGERIESTASADIESSVEGAPSQEQQMSYYQMAKAGYQQLVNAIIRPPRCEYDTSMLGPAEFTFCGRGFMRNDFTIVNARGLKVMCSMWEPVPEDRPNPLLPCVVYLHGNSSARPEALTVISLVLSLGATLFSFDFCGSGLSDGDYVSLGVNEKDDLQAAIEHLRAQGTTSYIALWGRSMGAGAALLHGERDPSIAGMVLDSCYSDLTTLAEEMVEKGRQHGLFAPGMLVRMALSFIRSTIQKTALFDIKEVSPIKGANKCYIPAMLVAARGDDFVTPSHSESICEVYAGDHNLVKVDGDHNSNRPYFLFQSAGIFLANTLMLPEAWGLPGANKYIGGVRPWDQLGPDMGGPPYNNRRGPRLKPYFVGMDEDDAALERVLALSLLEHANIQQQQQVAATTSGVAGVVITAGAAAETGASDSDSVVTSTAVAKAKAQIHARSQLPAALTGDGVAADGLGLCTASDISSNQPGGVDLGMTRARQENLHHAIYNMFGGTASSAAGVGVGVSPCVAGNGSGGSGGGGGDVSNGCGSAELSNPQAQLQAVQENCASDASLEVVLSPGALAVTLSGERNSISTGNSSQSAAAALRDNDQDDPINISSTSTTNSSSTSQRKGATAFIADSVQSSMRSTSEGPASHADSEYSVGNNNSNNNNGHSSTSDSYNAVNGPLVLDSIDENEGQIGIACSMCTLLNSPGERFCAACNHSLLPDLYSM